MHRIGAALGHHVDVSAQCAAEFGLAARRDHLKLVHYIETIERPCQTGCIVIIRKTVDDEAVGEVPLASYGNPLAGDRRGLGEELAGRGVGGRHSRDQQSQVEQVASIERQGPHLALRDRACNLRACRLQQLRLAADGDVGLRRSDREHDRKFIGGPQADGHQTPGFRETHPLNPDFVLPDPQVGKTKSALLVRKQSTNDIGIDLTGADFGVLNHRPRRVRDTPADTPILNGLLRGGGDCAQSQKRKCR